MKLFVLLYLVVILSQPSNKMSTQNTNKAVKTRKHLYSAFIVGGLSSVLLQPLDLLKTRKQQKRNKNQTYNLKNVIKSSNFLDLWKGTLPSFLRTSIGSALYLTSLNSFRNIIFKFENNGEYNKSSTLPKISHVGNLISASFARSSIGFLLMPLTVIKTRFESTLYNYNTLSDAYKDIMKESGFKGFFKGFGSTILRDSPYAGIYLMNYELTKTFLNKYSDNSLIINSSSAIFAATFSSTITAPFDTIRVRIQLQPDLNKNLFNTFTSIVKNEGVSNLFDGLTLRLIRKSLAAGIAWGVYEELIK